MICSLVIILVVVCSSIALTGGFFAGKYSVESHSTSTNMVLNWGDKINADGEEVDILSWFDHKLSADNVKSNLE